MECCGKDNIHGMSLTKEARVDPKVVLELSAHFREYFFLNKQAYLKKILQALLLVTKQAEPIKGLLNSSSFVCLALSFPPLSSPPCTVSNPSVRYAEFMKP